MAKVSILSWADIPSVVEARDGEERHKVELSARFQELIDMAAMRRGLAGTDAYLEAWRRGRPADRPGSAREVAEAVAAELEARFETIRTDVIASFGT
ncbi:cvfA/B/C family virulence factor [Tepidamorphus gemmatus]|uniref:CvfA/B/C family virulence factor n=1 Tax=Tepidamorphus gemmatus TaxID=747076 RepID=A0A4R3MG45_9HYPH|nr:virulence factor [Tepidamorphus gemmatus]TCT12571.1 cvfA/B/C family virulence factor [Tepidamorphus gemmatus]